MALGRHLVAALPGSSTAALSVLVAGAPSTVVSHALVAKRAGPSWTCAPHHEYRPTAPRHEPASSGSAEWADATPIHPGLPDPSVQVNTYRDLIGRRGLEAMRTP